MNGKDSNLGNLEQSIHNLRKACWQKRMVFIDVAARRQKWERNLHFASGLISLCSGASVAALLLLIVGKDYLKIVGSLIGALAGILSLVVTTYFSAKDNQKIFEGAAKYGALIDKLFLLIDQIGVISAATIRERYERMSKEYSELAPHFDLYLPLDLSARLAELEQQWPSASRLGPAGYEIEKSADAAYPPKPSPDLPGQSQRS
jgi:energy-converting hydrogenase Eha subunit A